MSSLIYTSQAKASAQLLLPGPPASGITYQLGHQNQFFGFFLSQATPWEQARLTLITYYSYKSICSSPPSETPELQK